MVNERMKILFPAETDGVVFRNNAAITRIPKSSFQLKIRMKNQQKKGNVCFSLDPYKPTLEHSSQRVSFLTVFCCTLSLILRCSVFIVLVHWEP